MAPSTPKSSTSRKWSPTPSHLLALLLGASAFWTGLAGCGKKSGGGSDGPVQPPGQTPGQTPGQPDDESEGGSGALGKTPAKITTYDGAGVLVSIRTDTEDGFRLDDFEKDGSRKSTLIDSTTRDDATGIVTDLLKLIDKDGKETIVTKSEREYDAQRREVKERDYSILDPNAVTSTTETTYDDAAHTITKKELDASGALVETTFDTEDAQGKLLVREVKDEDGALSQKLSNDYATLTQTKETFTGAGSEVVTLKAQFADEFGSAYGFLTDSVISEVRVDRLGGVDTVTSELNGACTEAAETRSCASETFTKPSDKLAAKDSDEFKKIRSADTGREWWVTSKSDSTKYDPTGKVTFRWYSETDYNAKGQFTRMQIKTQAFTGTEVTTETTHKLDADERTILESQTTKNGQLESRSVYEY